MKAFFEKQESLKDSECYFLFLFLLFSDFVLWVLGSNHWIYNLNVSIEMWFSSLIRTNTNQALPPTLSRQFLIGDLQSIDHNFQVLIGTVQE